MSHPAPATIIVAPPTSTMRTEARDIVAAMHECGIIEQHPVIVDLRNAHTFTGGFLSQLVTDLAKARPLSITCVGAAPTSWAGKLITSARHTSPELTQYALDGNLRVAAHIYHLDDDTVSALAASEI